MSQLCGKWLLGLWEEVVRTGNICLQERNRGGQIRGEGGRKITKCNILGKFSYMKPDTMNNEHTPI